MMVVGKRIGFVTALGVLLLTVGGACGGGSKPAAAPVPVAAASEAAPAEGAKPGVAEAAGDPEARLTEAQCNEALDHATTLMKEDEKARAYVEKMNEARAELVAQCLEKGKQKNYDCLMAAKTFAELGGCEQPE